MPVMDVLTFAAVAALFPLDLFVVVVAAVYAAAGWAAAVVVVSVWAAVAVAAPFAAPGLHDRWAARRCARS